MDANYLNLLVHPLNKTPLRYNEQLNQLVDLVNHEVFAIKDQVPILLMATVETELTKTSLHATAGSSFQYKEHYQTDAVTYDYFKETENATEREEHNRLHQYILSQIPSGADWILDAGCGGGWLAGALNGKGKHVISMDISDINPVKAVKNVPAPTHYGLVADVFELPLKATSIDCIIASEIIEHVPDPKRFLAALLAALKPGGKLIVTTPYNEHIQYSLCIHCNQLTPHNAHLHSFTEESIKKFLPEKIKKASATVFNNKILVRLGIQRLFKFLPLRLWKGIEKVSNALTRKRAYRLMLVIEK
jgi:2-polyprenyl-3-methyl-5-hydroxy-6-metoxy-1,4-benzoquinol methylase/uncharacterized protein YbaR (Trm112 family)